MPEMTTRQDVHRPSQMDPADYRYVGCFSPPVEESDPGYFEMDWDLFPDARAAGQDPDALPWASVEHRTVNYLDDGTRWVRSFAGGCDHCGNQNVQHFTFYLHEPSGEIVSVGKDCAAKMGLDSRAAVESRERVERQTTRLAGERWLAGSDERRDAIKFLMGQLEDASGPGMPFYVFGLDGSKVLYTIRDDFYASVLRRFFNKGELSDKQVDAVLRSKAKAVERDAEQQDRDANLPEPAPVLTGRVEVAGQVLHQKWQDSDYGGAMKMLVVDDRGFKVWGTMPRAISEGLEKRWRETIEREGLKYPARGAGGYTTSDELRREPLRVRFTATVERSRDDETFGFFKRPTKAEVEAA